MSTPKRNAHTYTEEELETYFLDLQNRQNEDGTPLLLREVLQLHQNDPSKLPFFYCFQSYNPDSVLFHLSGYYPIVQSFQTLELFDRFTCSSAYIYITVLKQSNIDQTQKNHGKYTCIICSKHELMKVHLETKRHKDANIVPIKITNIAGKNGLTSQKEVPNASSKEVMISHKNTYFILLIFRLRCSKNCVEDSVVGK